LEPKSGPDIRPAVGMWPANSQIPRLRRVSCGKVAKASPNPVFPSLRSFFLPREKYRPLGLVRTQKPFPGAIYHPPASRTERPRVFTTPLGLKPGVVRLPSKAQSLCPPGKRRPFPAGSLNSRCRTPFAPTGWFPGANLPGERWAVRGPPSPQSASS